MNKASTEGDVRACGLHAASPALPTVNRSLCSTLVNHSTNSMPHKASAHDYQPAWKCRTTGIVKTAHHATSVASEILGTLSPYWAFASDDKIPLAGCTVFVTYIYRRGGSHSGGPCYQMGPIHSDLQLTTEFRFLDGRYIWLARTDERTMTGSRTAGIVSPALNVASFASRYMVVIWATRICV